MTNVSEENLDKEGLEVLAELEAEGHQIEGREKPADPSVEPEKPAVEPAVEPEKPKEGEGEGEGEKPKDPPPPAEPPKPAPERKPQYVPLPKYLETETSLKEANKKIEELTKAGAKPDEGQVDQAVEAVKKLVEKGYSEEDAKNLVDVVKSIAPNQALTPEQQKALTDAQEASARIAEREESLKNEEEKVKFENDFKDSVLKTFPHLEEHKDLIKEMAYSEEYAKTPLRAIALAYMDREGISPETVDVKTNEKSGGGTAATGEQVNFEDISEEQFNKMTPEEQEKFFAYQDAKDKKERGVLN